MLITISFMFIVPIAIIVIFHPGDEYSQAIFGVSWMSGMAAVIYHAAKTHR